MSQTTEPTDDYEPIQRRIAAVVTASRQVAAKRLNQLISATYWEIGRHIVES